MKRCINKKCIHRRGCKRYTMFGHQFFKAINYKKCISNHYCFLIRYRFGDGSHHDKH